MFVIILFLLLCALLLHIYFKIERGRVNLPGPPRLPIFGNLFQVEKRGYETAYKNQEKYGMLAYFSVINMHCVIIGDVKLAKELFTMDEFSGRPFFDILLMYEGETLGIINSEGELWEVHRRFALRQLRDFGFGKNAMETLIMDEVGEFCERVKQRKGSAVGGIKEKLSLAVVNSLWKVVSGTRFHQEDPNLNALTNHINIILSAPAESKGIIFFMPWLKYIIPEYTGYNKVRAGYAALKKFVTDAVAEHEKTFQPEACRDFIDVYLKEMDAAKNDPKSTFYGEPGRRQLASIIGDLFFAGTDTTATTLTWAFLYFVTYPEVQRKIQDEITSITGDTRPVSVTDKPNMPYLQAAIEEVFRKSSIVPNGIQHEVVRDVKINGVKFPKGTLVALNIYYVHHNPKIWGDPENFRPERFLSKDGKVFKKNENVVPFSVGKRQCLGEILARDTIFLFIANVLQQFYVKMDPNNPNPTLEPAVAFLINPQEYSVVFEGRADE